MLITLVLTLLLSEVDTLHPEKLYTWILLLLGLVLYRLQRVYRFLKNDAPEKLDTARARRMYRNFSILALLTAFMAGIAAPLFAPYLQDPYLQFTLYTYIIGTAVGAMAALFPSFKPAAAYAVLITHIGQIASHLGYSMIAEGIEAREQTERLPRIYPEIMCRGFYYRDFLEFA